MEQEMKDAFCDLKKHITTENEHQDEKFDLFKNHHETEAKPIRDMVKKHDKEIYGKKGLLVKFAEMDIRTKIFGGVTGLAFVIAMILKFMGKI